MIGRCLWAAAVPTSTCGASRWRRPQRGVHVAANILRECRPSAPAAPTRCLGRLPRRSGPANGLCEFSAPLDPPRRARPALDAPTTMGLAPSWAGLNRIRSSLNSWGPKKTKPGSQQRGPCTWGPGKITRGVFGAICEFTSRAQGVATLSRRILLGTALVGALSFAAVTRLTCRRRTAPPHQYPADPTDVEGLNSYARH